MSANFANRTIWEHDCLYVLRGMNSECVDLIYLDPPFNSNADYAAPIGSKAAGAEFKDTWSLSDVDAEWINFIEERYPALHRVLLAALTDSDKSYLAYMAIRLLEMKRVLKPTGSIYLHCDATMSHFLKLVMDCVFGRKAFRNEITWQRVRGNKRSTGAFPRNSDRILFYAGTGAPFERQYMPLTGGGLVNYRHKDPNGRIWRKDNVSAPGGGGYVFSLGLGEVMPSGGYRMPEKTARKWLEEGSLGVEPGRNPYRKRYLDQSRGSTVSDTWTDINVVKASSKEGTGYPTQKPLKLLDRIIKASSNPGDMVLDPFCGCATTCVAAETLGREWAGIDLSPKALELVRERLADQHGIFGQIIGRKDRPQRTDLGKLPPPHSHKDALYGKQGGDCNGCGEHFHKQHLEVDHIIARSKGGTDHVENLQLLCGHCNRTKGNRGMAYLRTRLQLHG